MPLYLFLEKVRDDEVKTEIELVHHRTRHPVTRFKGMQVSRRFEGWTAVLNIEDSVPIQILENITQVLMEDLQTDPGNMEKGLYKSENGKTEAVVTHASIRIRGSSVKDVETLRDRIIRGTIRPTTNLENISV